MRKLLFNFYSTAMTLLIVFVVGFTSANAYAASDEETAEALQQITVTGTVVDENGDPMPGVNIIVKGTTTGTFTDANGKYKLSVPAGDAVLEFTFIGYAAQEVKLGGRSVVDISMKPESMALEEIVVIGYGTQKKVNLTGAVSAVKVDEIMTNRTLSNVSSGLSGVVPGLMATQSTGMAGKNSAHLTIRGLGTVNNANPLIVVDGMPDVDINRINMNDVESISVLKDATSSAVYGSRAANGVILITTKTGKNKSKPSIDFTGSYAFVRPTNKISDFISNYPRTLTLHQLNARTATYRDQLIFKDGTIDEWLAMGMIDPVRFPNTDWWDLIMRNGAVQNYNLSISGSNDKSNFYASFGIMDEKGLQVDNNFKRYNARLNYDYKLVHNMNVGVRIDANTSKMTYSLPDGFTNNAHSMGGFDLKYSIPGIYPYDPETGRWGGVMAYGEDLQAYHPLVYMTQGLNNVNRQEANGNVYLDWTLVKGFIARVDFSAKYYNQFTKNAPMPTGYAYNFQTGEDVNRQYIGSDAGVSNGMNNGYKFLSTAQLKYNTTIADNHDLSLMAVYSEEYWYDRNFSASRNNRIHPSLKEINAALTDIQGTGGSSNAEGLRSFIGRVNYTAFDKYLFEFNFRYDGSSRFLSGHQYGFFPSGAIAWRFTEEEFIRPFTESWLSNGKLRLSYGSLGNNSGVGRYEQRETLALQNYMIDEKIVRGFVNRKMVNRDLSWEVTTVFNAGLDLGFLKNRLTAELDYYDRLTTGMNRPSQMSIHLTGAYTAPRSNIGNLRNRGIELNVTLRDQVNEWRYSLNANVSFNATVLEKWNEFLGRGWTFLDMPYHFLYTYESMGIAQTWKDVLMNTPQGCSPGDLLRKDLNGDGIIDGKDRKAYPHIQRDRPTTNFGFSGNVAYKGFDFIFLLQGAAGRKDFWLNDYNNVNFNNRRYASSWDHWNKPWNLDRRDGEWPRLGGSNNRNEDTFWLDNMTFLRVKNVQLGYTISNKRLIKVGITNLRFYVSGENLFTITSYRGLDPEKTGHKSDAYPLTRSFSVGINLNI